MGKDQNPLTAAMTTEKAHLLGGGGAAGAVPLNLLPLLLAPVEGGAGRAAVAMEGAMAPPPPSLACRACAAELALSLPTACRTVNFLSSSHSSLYLTHML